MYTGYGSHFKVRAENVSEAAKFNVSDKEKDQAVKNFADMLGGFTYFDSVLMNRIKIKQPYQRFVESDLDVNVESDKKRKVIEFVKETQNFVYNFAATFGKRIGNARMVELADMIFKQKHGPNRDLAEEEKEFRVMMVQEVKKFGKSNLEELGKMAEASTASIIGLSGSQATKEEVEQLRSNDKAK